MPTALELCAGAGGQAIGFEGAGFAHVALIDNDPHACASLRMNRPYWNVIEADLCRLDASYWRGHVDVVTAGIPCPPFSIAGRQKGETDERDLFPALLKVVRHVRPRAVVVENVRGLMARRFAPYRDRIAARLAELDFRVDWRMLDAFEFGAPQHRTRTFLVAVPDGLQFAWPAPNCVRGGTVGDVLRDMMAANGWERADEWADRADKPAPTLVGGSKRHGGPDLGPTRARAAWAALGVDGRGIANLPPPRLFDGTPRLTVEMAARLQSFPEGWKLAGSKTQRYRQIGNALPVDLGRAVARAVAKCLAEAPRQASGPICGAGSESCWKAPTCRPPPMALRNGAGVCASFGKRGGRSAPTTTVPA